MEVLRLQLLLAVGDTAKSLVTYQISKLTTEFSYDVKSKEIASLDPLSFTQNGQNGERDRGFVRDIIKFQLAFEIYTILCLRPCWLPTI